jgi:translation initiation factor 2 gamma subunit (eIF-2gamma)
MASYLRDTIYKAVTRALVKHEGFRFDEDCQMLMPISLEHGINVDVLVEAILTAIKKACE